MKSDTSSIVVDEANKAGNVVSEGSDDDEISNHKESEKNRDVIATKRKPRTSSRRLSMSSNHSGTVHHPHHEKHYVEHNYHDHLRDPFEAGGVLIEDPNDITSPNNHKKLRRGHRGGVAVPFPEKLHYMLSRMEEEDTADIVSWQPHGRCFTVHKPKEFVQEIMPKYFKQTKLTSFQRQLNLYGFSRLTAGPDRGGYYHELFIRGRMDLCKRMVRTRVKGNGSKAASSPSTEPNFYVMPPCTEESVRKVSMSISESAAAAAMAIIDESSPPSDVLMMVSSSEEAAGVVVLPELDAVVAPTMAAEEETGITTTEDPPTFEGMIDETNEIKMASFADDASAAVGAETSYTPPPPMSPPTIRKSTTMLLPGGVSPCPPSISLPIFPSSSNLLPIVSPCEPKPLVSASCSPALLASLSIPTDFKRPVARKPSNNKNVLPENIHSGDTVFFEGLPFHYLETKDVEDSLRRGH